MGFPSICSCQHAFSGRAQTLQILVENKGRCDSSGMGEHDIGCARKGVYGNFTLCRGDKSMIVFQQYCPLCRF